MEKARDNLNQQPQRGFTLAELLVVLAVVACLAVTLLPALAATKHNSRLIQCQSNLRQIGAACAMYANDFNGWYPVTSVGFNNYALGSVNHLENVFYTWYVWTPFSGTNGMAMPKSLEPGTDQNLGYLYADGLIGGGHALFCPSFNDITDPSSPLYAMSADFYSNPQFMSTRVNGSIRSSYMFNPRLVNAYGYPTSSDILRRYQKSSDVKSRDAFAIDYLASSSGSLTGTLNLSGAPFTPDYWAHWPGKGLNVLFTDGSAKFCVFNSLYFNAIVKNLYTGDSKLSAIDYDQIFNALRDSP